MLQVQAIKQALKQENQFITVPFVNETILYAVQLQNTVQLWCFASPKGSGKSRWRCS